MTTAPIEPVAESRPACGHVTTHLAIQRICIAAPGPPPGARPTRPHVHYYVRRYPPPEES
jgi:hypothetical protein